VIVDTQVTPENLPGSWAQQGNGCRSNCSKARKLPGSPTDLWTCPRGAEHIERSFGVRNHVDHDCRLLHAMKWSPQKPARKAIERDEEGIGQCVKQTRPAIKRKREG
jgi:transposase